MAVLMTAPQNNRQGVYEWSTDRAMTAADFGTDTHLRISLTLLASDLVDPQTNIWFRLKRSANGNEPWLPVVGGHFIGAPGLVDAPSVMLARDVAVGQFLRGELDILNRVRVGAVVEAVTPVVPT